MDFTAAETFVHVGATGSFRGAARRLGVPASTVSRRVARLEDDLGVRLVQRTTRQLRLTDAGERFCERARVAIRDLEEAGRAAREVQDVPSGLLRITAPLDVGRGWLPGVVADFQATYREVDVHVELTNRLVDVVGEGFDLALRGGRLADSTLVARPLVAAHMTVFATPALVADLGMPDGPEDLASWPFVLFRPTGDRVRLAMERVGGPPAVRGARVTVEVRGRVSTNELGCARDLMLRGLGACAVPSFVGAPHVRRGELVALLPEWVGPRGALSLVYPSARFLPAHARAFRDFLLSHADPETIAGEGAPRSLGPGAQPTRG